MPECVAKSLHSCLTLCNPMYCSPLGSSDHGILQVRLLAWVAMPSSRGSSQRRYRTHVSHFAGSFLLSEPPGKPFKRLRDPQKQLHEAEKKNKEGQLETDWIF